MMWRVRAIKKETVARIKNEAFSSGMRIGEYLDSRFAEPQDVVDKDLAGALESWRVQVKVGDKRVLKEYAKKCGMRVPEFLKYLARIAVRLEAVKKGINEFYEYIERNNRG